MVLSCGMTRCSDLHRRPQLHQRKQTRDLFLRCLAWQHQEAQERARRMIWKPSCELSARITQRWYQCWMQYPARCCLIPSYAPRCTLAQEHDHSDLNLMVDTPKAATTPPKKPPPPAGAPPPGGKGGAKPAPPPGSPPPEARKKKPELKRQESKAE